MGVNRVTKRDKRRIEVRKRWPDGSTFRRYYPNMILARRDLARIEESIFIDRWKELKEEFSGVKNASADVTVEEFSRIYLDDYCRHHNRRPDFKKQALVSINQILGKIRLKDLRWNHADEFVSQRSEEVAPATINRGLAVIKNMLNFAVKRGYLEANPLVGFGSLPEEQVPLRMMTLEQERRLVMCVADCNPVIGAYVAILGETGLRKSEGLRMKWADVDFEKKMLTVPKSKTGEPRYIPLSDYAIEWLSSMYSDNPWVFTLSKGKSLKDPRDSFSKGRKLAGLEWVRGLHDLRHFRATQWLTHGVDIYSVKDYLGHTQIETTQRYLHFVPDHAERAVRAAQNAEQKEIEQLVWKQSGRHMGDTTVNQVTVQAGHRAK